MAEHELGAAEWYAKQMEVLDELAEKNNWDEDHKMYKLVLKQIEGDLRNRNRKSSKASSSNGKKRDFPTKGMTFSWQLSEHKIIADSWSEAKEKLQDLLDAAGRWQQDLSCPNTLVDYNGDKKQARRYCVLDADGVKDVVRLVHTQYNKKGKMEIMVYFGKAMNADQEATSCEDAAEASSALVPAGDDDDDDADNAAEDAPDVPVQVEAAEGQAPAAIEKTKDSPKQGKGQGKGTGRGKRNVQPEEQFFPNPNNTGVLPSPPLHFVPLPAPFLLAVSPRKNKKRR